MFSKLAKITLVSLLSVAALAVSFELYLRWTGFLKAQPASYPCIQGDPILNHVFIPGCKAIAKAEDLKTDSDAEYVVNSFGMRDAEPQPKKKKFLVMGDSYTEGFGLDNGASFSAVLQTEFDRLELKGWQTVNAGILGFSPALYGLYFEQKVRLLRPSFVLLNLDYTDMGDDLYYLQSADFGPDARPVAFPGREVFPPWLAAITYSNKSALLRFIHQELNLRNHSIWKKRNLPRIEALISSGPPVIDPEWLKEVGQEQCAKNYELTARFILLLQDEVNRSGALLGIHVYPPGYLVKKYPEAPQNVSFWRKWEQLTQKDSSWSCYTNEKSMQVWKKFAERNKIYFFDSHPLIFAQSNKAELYFSRDAHWNAAGVRLVAHNLAPLLAKILQRRK